ncbi:MAG: hypothetical protein ACRDS9_04735 [Pseudonocardiaceae bacterium]
MAYDVPGLADQLSSSLVMRWNETIQDAYDSLERTFGSRFFTWDPGSLESPVSATVKWFGDPAEPNFCISPETAQKLSDWGVRGRQMLHNEYCEYHTMHRPDTSGRMRPKRVIITTELREYWVNLAMHDPDAVRGLAASVLGFEPSWEDLYGVANPASLSTQRRKVAFSRLVAGHGNDNALAAAGVPAQPTGPLNTEHALFMTHPINGLDDLLYIVMFGARPYARQTSTGLQPATREQIFRAFGVEHLACRHADPAAALGAHAAVFNGQPVAFANPFGMYIQSFSPFLFLYEDNPIPDGWVRLSRGEEGMHQRLEFGPGDEDDAFLDDIQLIQGDLAEPVVGGYQVVQQLEVGPKVVAGAPTEIGDDEYVMLNASGGPIRCQDAAICPEIRQLRDEFEASQPLLRIAPRTMGRVRA